MSRSGLSPATRSIAKPDKMEPCWWCSKKLTWRSKGRLNYALVTGYDWHQHKVHIECKEEAESHTIKGKTPRRVKRHPDDPKEE